MVNVSQFWFCLSVFKRKEKKNTSLTQQKYCILCKMIRMSNNKLQNDQMYCLIWTCSMLLLLYLWKLVIRCNRLCHTMNDRGNQRAAFDNMTCNKLNQLIAISVINIRILWLYWLDSQWRLSVLSRFLFHYSFNRTRFEISKWYSQPAVAH